jgi:hypothetical protein
LFRCLFNDNAHDTTIWEKNEKGQIIGCKRAWQVVHALLPEFTAHWLRAFGEDFLYGEWDHDLLAVRQG